MNGKKDNKINGEMHKRNLNSIEESIYVIRITNEWIYNEMVYIKYIRGMWRTLRNGKKART